MCTFLRLVTIWILFVKISASYSSYLPYLVINGLDPAACGILFVPAELTFYRLYQRCCSDFGTIAENRKE